MNHADSHDRPVGRARQKEQKDILIEKVTRAVVDSVGCPPEAVHMIIREVEKSNWGIGGKPADKLPTL